MLSPAKFTVEPEIHNHHSRHLRKAGKANSSAGALRSGEGGPQDGEKLLGVEAGAADQGTVHVRLPEQRTGIVRVHAASVLNNNRRGCLLAESLPNPAAQEG